MIFINVLFQKIVKKEYKLKWATNYVLKQLKKQSKMSLNLYQNSGKEFRNAFYTKWYFFIL